MPDQPPASAPTVALSPRTWFGSPLWAPPGAPQVRVAAVGLRIGLDGTGAQPGDVLALSDGGGALGAGLVLGEADVAAGFVAVDTPALADGPHAITARLLRAGVEGEASVPYPFTVDTAAPAAPVVLSTGGLVNTGTVLVSGTGEPGTAVYLQASYDRPPDVPYVSPYLFGQTITSGTRFTTGFPSLPPIPLVVAADGTWSGAVTLEGVGRTTVTASSGDAAGNGRASAAPVTFVLDTAKPYAVSTSADGPAALQAGRTVTLFVTLSEPVVVDTAGGTPAFQLAGGGTAAYASLGADGRTLGFGYQVQPGDTLADLVVASFDLRGATIRDAAGNGLSPALPALVPPGTALLDFRPPTVDGVDAQRGVFSTGDTFRLGFLMDEAVRVDLSGGTPTLRLSNGAAAAYAPDESSALRLAFRYTPGLGESTMSLALAGISLNGATIRDAAGNDASLSRAVGALDGTVRIAADPLGTTLVQQGARSVRVSLGASANSVFLFPNGSAQVQALYNVAALQFIDGRLVLDRADPVVAVASLYRAALGRGADQDGLEHWAGRARSAGLGEVARGMLASAEGQAQLGPLPDAAFVAQLYRNSLGRAPDAGELASWLGRLGAGASRAEVLAGVAGSDGARAATVAAQGGVWDLDEGAATVARLYQTVLGRAPDTGGLAFWTAAVNAGVIKGGAARLGAVADALLASDEGRAAYGMAGGAGFVQAAYARALGRPVDAAGAEYWAGQLRAGASRGVVLAVLSESAEHVALTADATGSGPGGFGVRLA